MKDTDQIGILGYGMEGQAVHAYLHKEGFRHITILDKKEVSPKFPAACVTGDTAFENLDRFDVLVRSPGISPLHPEVQKAKEEGTALTSQLEIFLEQCPAKVVGITGTKGKTTTASLLAHMLGEQGVDVHLGGNMGAPMLAMLEQVSMESLVVLELSSFQLQQLGRSPACAVVLGVTREHMDYHGSMEEYVDAKAELVRHQVSGDWKVVVQEGEVWEKYASSGEGELCLIGSQGGVKLSDGGTFEGAEVLYIEGDLIQLGGWTTAVSKVPVRSKALLSNYLACLACVHKLELDMDQAVQSMQSFEGVAHRMQKLGKKKGVTYWDDGAATTPEATMAALESFKEPVLLVLGGGEKHAAFEALIERLWNTESLKVVVTTGEACGKRIAGLIDEKAEEEFPHFVHIHIPSYEELPETITEFAEKGMHVLLSPACSSFDEFENYKERSKKFQDIFASK